MTRIQKSAIAGIAALAALSVSGAALAADLPVKAPAPIPLPIYSWTGFYIGGHVGAGWGTTETDVDVGNVFIGPPVNETINQLAGGVLNLNVPLGQTQMNGFLGGLQTGYNWQTGVFVFGVEGDFTWSGIKGSTSCVFIFNCTSEARWIADITGRLGVTVGDRGLVYIKGGGAWTDTVMGFNQSASFSNANGTQFAAAIGGSATDNRFGGTLGAGIEYAFLPGWSVKLEYDYYDFGKHSMVMPIAGSVALGANTTPFSVTAPINVNEQIHTIRIGVNYNFNSPAVARY